MYKNIGKKIHILAIVLAALTAAGFLAAAVVFLFAAFRAEAGTTVRAAGFEGAGVFLVLAVLSPLFSWVLYGFGSLVDASERQAEQNREIRDLLKKALSDGALSDEISRKLTHSLSKLTPPAAQAPRTGVAPTRPVVRGSAARAAATPAAPAGGEPEFTPAAAPRAQATPEAFAAPRAQAASPEASPEASPAANTPEKPGNPEKKPAPAITFTAPSAAKREIPAGSDDTDGAVAPVRPLHSDTTY